MAAALRPYIVERGVGYGFNDIPMGMTNQDSAEACAAACTAKGTGPACIAWTWAAATHPSWPGQCRMMSARGSDIQQEPGLVSGYLSGEARSVHKQWLQQECRAGFPSGSSCRRVTEQGPGTRPRASALTSCWLCLQPL
jgi:hypothetical protein